MKKKGKFRFYPGQNVGRFLVIGSLGLKGNHRFLVRCGWCGAWKRMVSSHLADVRSHRHQCGDCRVDKRHVPRDRSRFWPTREQVESAIPRERDFDWSTWELGPFKNWAELKAVFLQHGQDRIKGDQRSQGLQHLRVVYRLLEHLDPPGEVRRAFDTLDQYFIHLGPRGQTD